MRTRNPADEARWKQEKVELRPAVCNQNAMPMRSESKSRTVAGAAASRDLAVTLIALFVLLAAAAVHADTPFPGRPPDRELLEVQSRVDSLFESGHYNRALLIYRNELAPLGDKYAQYMIGYMHLAGKGVEKDIATAAAWYRLAAERGQETFVRENRKLSSLLEPGQRERSERVFRELRKQYGDAALILDLVEDDVATLAAASGSEPLALSGVARREQAADRARIERLERRTVERLEYLDTLLRRDPYADADERDRLEQLESQAVRLLRELRARR